jgi:hypothetical protein
MQQVKPHYYQYNNDATECKDVVHYKLSDLQMGNDDPCPPHTFYKIGSDVPSGALVYYSICKRYSSQDHLSRPWDSCPTVCLLVHRQI